MTDTKNTPKDQMRKAARLAFERVLQIAEDTGLDPLSAGREGGEVAIAIHNYFKALAKCET